MFERFTEKAIRAVGAAEKEARLLNHNFIGTELLLLGLLTERTGIASRVLVHAGVTLEAARAQVTHFLGRGSGSDRSKVLFTPRCKKVFELANEEAAGAEIETIHLLLGILTEHEGSAIRVLRALSVDIEKLNNNALSLSEAVLNKDALYYATEALAEAARTLRSVHNVSNTLLCLQSALESNGQQVSDSDYQSQLEELGLELSVLDVQLNLVRDRSKDLRKTIEKLSRTEPKAESCT